VEMCFVVVGSLRRAERISWCRVSRPTTVAVQKEERKRIVAHIEVTSLFLSEDGFKVMRVDCGVASISFF